MPETLLINQPQMNAPFGMGNTGETWQKIGKSCYPLRNNLHTLQNAAALLFQEKMMQVPSATAAPGEQFEKNTR